MALDVFDLLDEDEGRRGNAGLADDRFRQPLVQADGQHEGIGERVGDLVEVQNGRHLGLAGRSVQALGDVEHQVPAVAGRQAVDQLPPAADAVGLMADFSQGRVDGIDRGHPVELGGFLCRIARGQIVSTQVVGQADAHGGGFEEQSSGFAGCGFRF